eukprot:9497762-Pyramimonas_sp.AAC.1
MIGRPGFSNAAETVNIRGHPPAGQKLRFPAAADGASEGARERVPAAGATKSGAGGAAGQNHLRPRVAKSGHLPRGVQAAVTAAGPPPRPPCVLVVEANHRQGE